MILCSKNQSKLSVSISSNFFSCSLPILRHIFWDFAKHWKSGSDSKRNWWNCKEILTEKLSFETLLWTPNGLFGLDLHRHCWKAELPQISYYLATRPLTKWPLRHKSVEFASLVLRRTRQDQNSPNPLWNNFTRHTCESVAHFLWKSGKTPKRQSVISSNSPKNPRATLSVEQSVKLAVSRTFLTLCWFCWRLATLVGRFYLRRIWLQFWRYLFLFCRFSSLLCGE